MSSIVLSLDLGTTGNRCIAVNNEGTILASHYCEFTQYFPEPGWVEHDPIEILNTTKEVLKKTVDQVKNEKIVSIGITNQRETTVIWDKTTGIPIHNAIVWQCRRTTEICITFKEHQSIIKEKTGLLLDPYFSATKIKWLLDTYDNLDKDNLLFGTIDSWIIWNLSINNVHVTDITNASRTMLFNINTLSYDQELLNLFNVPEKILPTVLDNDGEFGVLQINKQSIPINCVIGDQQASLFAQCGHNKNSLKNTYGTGLFVCARSGERILQSKNLISTIGWKLNNKIEYAVEGSIFIGGSAIQWLRDQCEFIESAKETEKIANNHLADKNVIVVPAFSGLGAPYWDPNARGMIIGISRGTTKEDITVATLKSLAFQTRDIIEEIKKVQNDIYFDALYVDGGASENTFLMQFQADLLKMNVLSTSQKELTALGCAGISGINSKLWTKDKFFNVITYNLEITAKSTVDIEYYKWNEAVKRCLNWVK